MKLRVKVAPGSRLDAVRQLADGTFQIKIREVPEGGKANQYLIRYLSQLLKLPLSSITILRGKTNSIKLISIEADEHLVHQQLQNAANI
ncbi:MAG: DUF167 domain-containing protein [Chitinophagales bacterium]|nr:DUF167 domain-containing protein [Chitinophagales bacterium]